MYSQLEYLRSGATMTLGTTFRIDLPETGLLSGLFLKLSANCTSGATLADPKWRLQDHLERIEVIANGATVIKSIDWKNAAFLHFMRQGVTPLGAWRNYAENTQFEYLLILFGRYLDDPLYGLDLSLYDNVELRVTNTSSATYHSTNITANILQAFLRDTAGGFQGHVRSEVWREWTGVADETQYFVLPTEYPFCGLHIRAMGALTNGIPDCGLADLIDDIDFTVNGGQNQVYKGAIEDLAIVDYYRTGKMLITGGMADVTADKGISASLGRSLRRATAQSTKDGAVAAGNATIESDLTNGVFKSEERTADEPIEFMFQGYSFQNHVTLMHSPNLASEELLVPSQAGEIRLNVHTKNDAASDAGINQVVIERVVA